jgi:hypothetical protein
MTNNWSLIVEYKGGLDVSIDRAVEKGARKERDGSGFSFLDGTRDLSFSFTQGRFAEAAKARIKAMLGRKVTTRIVSPEAAERALAKFDRLMERG